MKRILFSIQYYRSSQVSQQCCNEPNSLLHGCLTVYRIWILIHSRYYCTVFFHLFGAKSSATSTKCNLRTARKLFANLFLLRLNRIVRAVSVLTSSTNQESWILGADAALRSFCLLIPLHPRGVGCPPRDGFSDSSHFPYPQRGKSCEISSVFNTQVHLHRER